VRIQLFNPPVHHYSGVQYRMNPPLGLPIIAAVLEQSGHEAHIWDLEALGISPQRLGQSYEQQRGRWPDAVGFTCTTHNARGCKECTEVLRDVGYDGYIIVGGPHVSINEDTALVPLEWGADAVMVGECEEVITEVFEGQWLGVLNGVRMGIEYIPGPLWRNHHPQPTEYYGNMPRINFPEGIAMWSRGCPHDCIFCGNPVFHHQRIRMRPPERIYEDMSTLKELGVKTVFVYDDELVGAGYKQSTWLRKTCERIAPLGLTWKCQGRCSQKIDRATLQAMYNAGCRAVMWGIESFSERVLQAIHKGTTEDDIWHTLRLAHEVGIGNWGFFMVGNYRETGRDLAYTEKRIAQAAREGLLQWRQVTVCTPVPGAKLYDMAKEEGWLVEPPESGPQMNQTYASTPWLSEREIRHWKARLEGA